MSFVTSAKYLIGLAVASSVSVVLAGTALAADASIVAPAHSQTSDVLEQVNLSDSAPGKSIQDAGQSVTTIDQSNTTATTVRSTHETSTVVGGSTSGTSGSIGADASTTGPDASPSLVSPTAGDLPVAPRSENANSALTEDKTSTESSPKLTAALNTDMPSVTAVPVAYAVPTMVVGDQRLPIQPVITAHAALPTDLAPSTPAAPVRNSVPTPAQPNGLLSALSISLIPALVSTFGLGSVAAAMPHQTNFPVLKLMLVLSGFVILAGFVMQLRQGGFVSAARSDVATAVSSFATSLSMSYAAALSHLRSSFLVMSDTKTFSVMFVTL